MNNTDGISVVVCTYDDSIEFFERCINSLFNQKAIKELIIVDSSKSDTIRDFCVKRGGKIKYCYKAPKGLSEARNEGVLLTNYNIVAFTDPDCVVDKDWAENLYESFSAADNIAIVGGKIFPRWLSEPNKIFLNSSIAQGFYSFFDMGDQLRTVDIIFGAGFAINKSLIKKMLNIFFLPNLRKKNNLICGEETNLCKRVRDNKLKVIYNPSVVVWHQIPKEKINFGWMRRRIYAGGMTRAMLGGMPTPKTVNYLNYNLYDIFFMLYFFPIYVMGFFCGIFKKK